MPTDSNKRIAKNTIFLYLRMGVVLAVQLYVTRGSLKVLGVEDYGIYNVVCGFVTLFSALNLSLSTCINRFYNYEIGKSDGGNLTTVYNTALLIQLLIAFVLCLFLETAGLWYINNKMVLPENRLFITNIVYHISVGSLLFTILQAPYTAAVLAYEKMDFYALVSMLNVFLKLGIVLILPLNGFDTLLLYAILMGLISVSDFMFYALYCKRKFSKIRLRFSYNRNIFKSMLSFIGWNFLDPISYNVRGQGCNILLNAFYGPIVNAAYTISNQVATALDSFTVSISTAFRPQLIQSYSGGNFQRSKYLMLNMSKIMFCLYLMISLPVIIESKQILNLWLGDCPKYAVEFTVFILIVKILNVLNPAMSTSIMATGKIRTYAIGSCVIICSIIPFSYLTLRLTDNPNSVYVWMIILTIINQIFCIKLTCKLFCDLKFAEYLKNVLRPCFVQTLFVLPIVCLVYLVPESVGRILLTFVLSGLSSLIIFYSMVLQKNERELVRNACANYLNKIKR